jgi:type IV pilus assembly protein PilB
MFNDQFEKLGELLLKSSMISEQQLATALAQQRTVKKKLGELLVEMNAVSEPALVKTLGEQINIPVVDPKVLEGADADLAGMIPEPFAREHAVLAVRRTDTGIEVAMADPENIATIDNLSRVAGADIIPLLGGRESITGAIDRVYGSLRKSGEVDTVMTDLEYEITDEAAMQDIDLSEEAIGESDAPIVKLVNIILSNAIADRATDIHIEPQGRALVVRNRVDGALVESMTAPVKSHGGVVARIKVMAKLNIAENRLPQDGRFSVKIAERAVDVRVSILPSVLGEKIVLRLLDKGSFSLQLTSLGFDDHDLRIFRKCINQPYGIVIISGPTGSGKSTTLYAALNEIKSIEDNIVTVEDPVEYQIEGITQVAVNERIDLTFASALRSILRQDPDKVLIGEIRDKETADIAMKVALTGHLVFTTLHANDTVSTVTRLIDIGVPPFLAGSSVVLVMAQRLIRTICPDCKEEYQPSELERELLNLSEEQSATTLFHGKGCGRCKNTGYFGRTGIFELMPISSPIRKHILESADQEEVRRVAIRQNMRTLRESAMRKMFEGVTTVREVLKHTVEEL